MSVIQKASAHFKGILAQNLRSIEVPEWETTIYFKPATTFAQEQKIVQLHAEGKIVEALVESLIQRALDESGAKMFKQADKPQFMNEVDPKIIMRCVTQMNAASEVSEADLGN